MDVPGFKPRPAQGTGDADPTVVVGWTHGSLPGGIELRVQSTRSQRALDNGDIESVRLCMTRNQALLLAHYLLDATNQELPVRRKRGAWKRLWTRT